jgi:molybdopterin/thiamine biosynthesis adenylyltransferase
VDLSGTRVAVLGCGSVGGLTAWCLANAGVTHLDLADRDRLGADNLRRHVCGEPDLGRRKATAVAGSLRARFGKVITTAHHFCFLEEPERLRALIEVCDLVLAAVDDEAPRYLIDAMARELDRPVVYAGVYGGGWAAEAIFTGPASETPCYGCTAKVLGRGGIPIQLPDSGPDHILPNAETSPSEWVRADLVSSLPCAALAARLASAWLARQWGVEQLWQEFQAANVNAWRLALRHIPAWGFGPWELRPVEVRSQPGCPVCSSRSVSLTDFDRLIEKGLV